LEPADVQVAHVQGRRLCCLQRCRRRDRSPASTGFDSSANSGWASVEALLQAERSPEVRRELARGNQGARRRLAAWLLGIPEDQVSEDVARSIGVVQLPLISGLMVQWINDPEHAPSANDVVAGLREIADRIA
jgi:hypothetical protein